MVTTEDPCSSDEDVPTVSGVVDAEDSVNTVTKGLASGRLVDSPAFKSLSSSAGLGRLVDSPAFKSLSSSAGPGRLVDSPAFKSLSSSAGLGRLVDSPAFKSLSSSAGLGRLVDSPAFKSLSSSAGLGRLVDSPAFKSLAEGVLGRQFRVLDSVVPPVFAGLELAATARVAHLLGSDSTLTGWREGLLGSHSAATLAATSPSRFEPMVGSLLAELARSSTVTAQLGAHAAAIAATQRRATPWPSQRPAVQLGRFLHHLPATTAAADLELAVSASSSVSSLLTIDVLTHTTHEGEIAAELFSAEVAPPWVAGPARARADLLDALREIGKDLPELLKGAWDDVERDGAAANVKISSCAVEVLERTLRALAPDADVISWHARANRPVDEVRDGRPTYGCRVRYVLRSDRHQPHRRLIVSQVDSVVAQVNQLRSELQAGKHASASSVVVVRGWLMAVETVLHQLTVALR